eukprot:s281_g36.t1
MLLFPPFASSSESNLPSNLHIALTCTAIPLLCVLPHCILTGWLAPADCMVLEGRMQQLDLVTLRGGAIAPRDGGNQPGTNFSGDTTFVVSTWRFNSVTGWPRCKGGIGIPPARGAAPRGNWWSWRQPARCPFASIACGSIPRHDGQARWEFGSRHWWCWRSEAFCSAPHGAAHLEVLLRTGIRFAGCTAPALVMLTVAALWNLPGLCGPVGRAFDEVPIL